MKKNLQAHTLPGIVLLIFSSFYFSTMSFAQPANDNCNNAIVRTSSLSCNNTQYRLRNATASAGIPVGCAPVGTHYDVWFQFVALSTTHTVTISNLQSNITNPRVQLFSGSCGALTSVVCGTTTMTATTLTIGNTYYIRVSNLGAAISSSDRFDICVTHPPPPPANDNCAAPTLLTSAIACNSVTGNLQYATNSAPTGTCGGATATTTYDVWYRFQATATTHAVTISGLGTSLTAATTYIQMLSGACGGLTSLGCQAASVTNGRMTIGGLTIGTFYYVRVYVTANPNSGSAANWNFNICVQQPPTNNDCAGAVLLTANLTCTNTAGTLDLATANGATPAGCFAAGTYYDVWYRFVATASATHTVTLSSLGANFTAPRIQIYGGTCAGLTPIAGACASGTTLTQGGLTNGTTYYVRIANFNTNPSGTGTVANFDICITRTPVPPSNDLCTGAISLSSDTICSNISGTLINAIATAGLPSCGNAASPDVWYSFVAKSAFPTITLSSVGGNLTSNNPRIQLFSGACGLLTQLTGACVASPLNTINYPGGAGLNIGATYYIRITTTGLSAPVTSGTYTFNICVEDPVPLASTIIDYAKSYVNITDGTVGGTINPGDELEIRATFVVRGTGTIVDSVAFFDTLRAGKGFRLKPASISTRTNEGKIYQSFTDASADADAGWYTTAGAGTDTAIQINMGSTGTRSAKGSLSNTSFPSLFTSTCVIMATYRVIVNAAYGTKINFGGGGFTYRDPATGSGIKIIFPRDSLMVYQSTGTCANTVTQSNILGDEFNGTFGAPAVSAGSQNRGTSPNTGYSYQAFNPGGPGDYFYGVPNNTSASNSIVQTAAKPATGPRVFDVWDITGDHTGAANPLKGNKPCNPALPISATNPCGYMLVVNSAYKTDLAFSFTVSGVCPNTYYEISAWLKNICYKCACDVQGRQPSQVGFIPTAPGDSSGVRPNIAFQINDIDYYTTGDILYQGLGGTQTGSDTLNNWVQKAFVYKTGPTETGFVLTMRNNAPGGGGNDWAIDDISLRTCYPNMKYSPSNNPAICENNPITINDTVRSYYNTYIEYKWQRSTDGGDTWVDIAGTTATATPVLVGGMYQYTATYSIPPAFTTAGHDGDLYRVSVATTPSNLLSTTCNFSDPTTITLDVLVNCGPVLSTDLLSVSGKLVDDKARVSWVTSREEGAVRYSVERSDDGTSFTSIATIDGHNNINATENHYTFDDPRPVTGKVYYRIGILDGQAVKKYSRTIQLNLSAINVWELSNVINPFYNELQYEISSPSAALATVELIDNYGKTIKRTTQRINQGVNPLTISNTGAMSTGIYLLKITINDNVVVRKVLKGKP